MVEVVNVAGRDPVDAGEGHAAEDAGGAEQFGEALFVAQAVLEREQCGVILEQRGDQRLVLVVGGGLQRDDDEVGGGHVAGFAVDVNFVGRDGKIAVAALDAQAGFPDGFVVGTEQEMDGVAMLGEAGAVVPADGAGADDGDDGGSEGHCVIPWADFPGRSCPADARKPPSFCAASQVKHNESLWIRGRVRRPPEHRRRGSRE